MIRPFRVGGNTPGIRKKNFIMGYDPLGWGEAFMESGRRTLSWDTRRGGSGGPPNIGRREGARGGDKGREGGERGWRWATGREGARGSEEI